MLEGLSRRQSLEAQRRLLEEELYRLYGPDYADGRWVSETLTRLRTQQVVFEYSEEDRADLRKAGAILHRMQAVAKFYNPDQPRDDHGRWTSAGALPNAVAYLEAHATARSRNACAAAVRTALEQDGIVISPTERPDSHAAKDYGPALEKHGFNKVAIAQTGEGYPPVGYTPEAGDVVIIQSTGGHKDGHMAMYTGSRWISDFEQPGFWPHSDYGRARPRYVIYRHNKKN